MGVDDPPPPPPPPDDLESGRERAHRGHSPARRETGGGDALDHGVAPDDAHSRLSEAVIAVKQQRTEAEVEALRQHADDDGARDSGRPPAPPPPTGPSSTTHRGPVDQLSGPTAALPISEATRAQMGMDEGPRVAAGAPPRGTEAPGDHGPPRVADEPSNHGIHVVDYFPDAKGFPASVAPELQDDNLGQNPSGYAHAALRSQKPSLEDARTTYHLTPTGQHGIDEQLPNISRAIESPSAAEGPLARGLRISESDARVFEEGLDEQKRCLAEGETFLRDSHGLLFEPATSNPQMALGYAEGSRSQDLGIDVSPDAEVRAERAIENERGGLVDFNPEHPLLHPEHDYNADIDAELQAPNDFERRIEDARNRVDERLAAGQLTPEQAEQRHDRLTHYQQQRVQNLERLRTTLDRATDGTGKLAPQPFTDEDRRDLMEEFLVVGDYRLVGLLDARDPQNIVALGNVAAVMPPAGTPPPIVLRVWEHVDNGHAELSETPADYAKTPGDRSSPVKGVPQDLITEDSNDAAAQLIWESWRLAVAHEGVELPSYDQVRPGFDWLHDATESTPEREAISPEDMNTRDP